ncbi:AraC family transcriptional regulator [Massilia sp. H-1]|nr:AraC family transcriptional regulator [Massilia sp. H-1]
MVGGPRASFYAKESGQAVTSIGVQLLPGAALGLFGVSAAELAERHTPLSELWGACGRSALDQIMQQASPQARLKVLETLLMQRLPRIQAMHPAVAELLANTQPLARIDALVRDSRYSHRHFIAVFREATGMGPKRYAMLMRFRAVLARLRDAPASALRGACARCRLQRPGAHDPRVSRFAGVTPLQYLQLAPNERESCHAPLGQISSRRGVVPVLQYVLPLPGAHHDS